VKGIGSQIYQVEPFDAGSPEPFFLLAGKSSA
jgi:hypothetical protein